MSPHLPAQTDVLIIGAGPTGLALAISLAQAGIDYVLIDKLIEGQAASRAAVVHAHTLEAMQKLGVAERLTAAGKTVSRFSLRERDRALVTLSFDHLPSPFSYLLMIPQDATERILAERLVELGGGIHRGVTATSIEQSTDGVRVCLQDGEIQRSINARYVVGADGMHSLVRESAGIAFDGEGYEHSFVLADVDMEWAHGADEVMLYFTDTGPLVVAPLPNGQYRVVAAMENAPAKPEAHHIQSLFDANGPKDGVRITSVGWSSRFRIHHRLAKRYRNGRLIVMGDAAHVHSPAGGQGMNCGLVDATVLGRILAAVVSGKRNQSALDLYEKLRRPAAAKVLELAGNLTTMAMTKGAVARAVRNARLTLADHLPPIKHKLIMNLTGLSRRAAAEVRI
jgi:2-polyprenyl-6-methoxyphenol hydroxylase-like FAD-dependent oxidoreductase